MTSDSMARSPRTRQRVEAARGTKGLTDSQILWRCYGYLRPHWLLSLGVHPPVRDQRPVVVESATCAVSWTGASRTRTFST